MRRSLLVSALVLLVAACSGAPISVPGATASATPVGPPPGATVVPGGCGSTPAFKGGVPAWLDKSGAQNNPVGLPYVVATPATAAVFLGVQLRAGNPENPANKILWVVGLPRNGSPLEISGHPVGASTPSVHLSQAANSSPGEIYPSIVNVPLPGCWHFDLAWAGHRAAVELEYL